MPKMLCVPCQVELVVKSNDIAVIEHAHFGPYKIWNADEWECPVCGATIIAGFADQPMSEHWQPDFESDISSLTQQHPEMIRRDFENQGQRAQWLMQQASTVLSAR